VLGLPSLGRAFSRFYQEIQLYGSSKAEFLDEIKAKVFRVFLHAIHGHLDSFALNFLFLQIHATSYSFYSSVICTMYRRKEENLIETHIPFPMVV
jgi:hypothetical protein